MTYSYEFYARRTPGDEKPSVWCGDVDGPNVYMVRRHPVMFTARVHAWWRNRHRAPRTAAGTSGCAAAKKVQAGSSNGAAA